MSTPTTVPHLEDWRKDPALIGAPPASPPRAPALSGAWWLPLAFVVVALLLLLGTPVIVDQRVTHLRADLSDRTDQARVLVNDLEAAMASELFARMELRLANTQRADSIHAAAVRKERVDERQLDSLVREISPEAVARFTELSTMERDWRRRYPSPTALQDATGEGVEAPDVMRAAERLDDYLEEQSAEIHGRVRRLETFGVLSAVVLVPMALASVVVVLWAGGRVVTFAHEMERDRAALARSTEARTALLRGVTHDVKNPLGAALGYAELLEDGIAGALSPEQGEMVRRIRRLVGVSLDTVSELLELARAESGAVSLELQDFDLGALVREVADDYRGEALAKSLELTTAIPATPVIVRTDAARVRRVVANMVSNALKYTPARGRVRVRVSAPERQGGSAGDRVAVQVADTGPGIPEHLRERIFEDFFRVPSSESTARGTGVGLAISRRLARLLGGDIIVEAAPDGGALFTFSIPASAGRT